MKTPIRERKASTYHIGADLIRQLKIYCARKNLKMSDVVQMAVKEFIEREVPND